MDGMFFKRLFQRYGIIFFSSYAGSFIILVTLKSKMSPAAKLPGDILIQNENFTIYLPIVGALALAAFVTIVFEIYRTFR